MNKRALGFFICIFLFGLSGALVYRLLLAKLPPGRLIVLTTNGASEFQPIGLLERDISLPVDYGLIAWAEEGNVLAYGCSLENKVQALCASRLDGKDRKVLWEAPTEVSYILALDWSLDGRFIAIETSERDEDAWKTENHAIRRLFAFDVQRGQPVLLAEGVGVNYSSVNWSPDAQQLTYLERRTSVGLIKVLRMDDLSIRDLGEGFFPAWTVDGARIVFSTYHTIYSIKPDGSGKKILFDAKTDGAPSFFSAQSPNAAFSPDGRFLAFTSGETRRLFIVDLEQRKAWQVSTLFDKNYTSVYWLP